MIKFSQYDSGSRLSSILYNINWEELIPLNYKEIESEPLDRPSWQPVYIDYEDNLSVSIQGTTSTSYSITSYL